MARCWILALSFGFAILALTGGLRSSGPPDIELFREKVAPILERSCLSCHNPAKSRGGLDLSSAAGLAAGGDAGPAVVPGAAKRSRLYEMVAGPAPKMPRQADPLSAEEQAIIARWIDAGAPWPKQLVLSPTKPGKESETWWSLAPLKRPAVPTVKDVDWCKTPIDHFILAIHEAKGLRASQPADRLTLLRRLKYDLHGLPPTPEEITRFDQECGPSGVAIPDAALERLVDRLLASPHYGERWARHWLDVVHYADTHGYDKDKRRLWAWLFRDWVIQAFNRDLPYRRFIHQQLAGDVLFPGDPDALIATGFVVAGPWDFVGHVELREGTVDKEKTRLLDRDDMVSNAIATFNSMTIHCARCHEHKFDPIPMRDYYQLQAVFAGVERGDRTVITAEVQARKLALEKQREEARTRKAKLDKRIVSLATPDLVKLDSEITKLHGRLDGLPPLPSAHPSPTNGYHSHIMPKPDATKWVQVDLGQSYEIDSVRLVPARPTDFPDTPGFGFPPRFDVALSDEPTFAHPTVIADHRQQDFPNPGAESVVISTGGRKARFIRVTAYRLWKRLDDYVLALGELQALAGSKNVARGAKVTALDTIDAGRWHTRHLVDGFDSRRQLPEVADATVQQRLDLEVRLADLKRQRNTLAERLIDPGLRREREASGLEVARLSKQLDELIASAKVYAVVPTPPRPIHILARGDVEKKGRAVAPGALSTIFPHLDHHFSALDGSAKPDLAEGVRRAALARWLSDDQNHLTWRSVVNRIWHYHFGRGLVDTPNDFGRNGSQPSHPELLDWLACEFRDGGDSFKRLHKMIVMSAVYRQASTHHADFAKMDGDNRYLWRMNRQRLDAESIRDSVLAVAGSLKTSMYGPGYELFRFQDDHSPVYDHLDVSKSTHPDTWRRTVYRFVVRSVPNPLLETLDCADPNINVPVRNTTLTALQALALLNNPFMVQQSQQFAQRLRTLGQNPAEQVDAAYRLAFGRAPSDAERAALAGYAQEHSLENACRLLFNANEFMFVD